MVLAVLALAAGSALAVWGGRGAGTEPLTAVVTVDGYTLTVAFGIDYENPASTAPLPSGKSGLYVAVSDCPTQDCVRTGIITQSGQSIVCLPARIIVQLTGAESKPGAVDAVVG